MKDNNQKGGVNPVMAAVAGAVVGAGVAVAGAMVLEDKKNREKVKKVFTDVKNQAIDYVEDMQKQIRDKRDGIEEKITDGKNKVQKVTKSVKKIFRSRSKGC